MNVYAAVVIVALVVLLVYLLQHRMVNRVIETTAPEHWERATALVRAAIPFNALSIASVLALWKLRG